MFSNRKGVKCAPLLWLGRKERGDKGGGGVENQLSTKGLPFTEHYDDLVGVTDIGHARKGVGVEDSPTISAHY